VHSSDLADLIRSRRTSMLVDKQREVPDEMIADLVDLAQWAPNHKRTWPWRFAVAQGGARSRLGNVIADAMDAHGDPPAKVEKTRGKYLRTPVTVIVGAAASESSLRTAENRDAVAAGIQNLLLAATSMGLASYWGSCPKGANDVVAELCDFEPGTHISGLIYLGWATTTVESPGRPAPRIHRIAARSSAHATGIETGTSTNGQ
jgi:nitroreductase